MPYRDPTPEETKNPLFNAIWDVIKEWDIGVHDTSTQVIAMLLEIMFAP